VWRKLPQKKFQIRKAKMKRIFLSVGAILFALAAPMTTASTHAPCSAHLAGTPYVDSVNPGTGEEGTTTTLRGSGGIGGCPVATTTVVESVTVHVCLQYLDNGAWNDKSCVDSTKGWNRYWRYARQDYVSVYATCIPGTWRTDVKGGDGFNPTEWISPNASFNCKELSGGD
jgi:hypothetical protein